MIDDVTKIWIVAFGCKPKTARVLAWVSLIFCVLVVSSFFIATVLANL